MRVWREGGQDQARHGVAGRGGERWWVVLELWEVELMRTTASTRVRSTKYSASAVRATVAPYTTHTRTGNMCLVATPRPIPSSHRDRS